MGIQQDTFNLEGFLGLEAVDTAELLCGHSCLEQEISRINVVEESNLCLWCEAGDLIVSSGYPFWKNPQLLAKTLPALQEAGVVGLALKPSRSDSHIPADVIHCAQQLDFPLIKLPSTVVFANIVYQGRDCILQSKELSLHQVQRQSQLLMEQLLHATNPVESLQKIEGFIDGNPVFACSNDNELIITATSNTILYDNLKGNIISRLRKHNTKSGAFALSAGKNPRSVQAHFHHFEGHRKCSLIVLEYFRPLQACELDVLERVIPVLALEISNALIIKKVRRKYKDRFLQNLIAGKLGNAAEICAVAHSQGYQVDEKSLYRVAVVLPQRQKPLVFSESDSSIISHYCRTLPVMLAFTLVRGFLTLVFEDDDKSTDFKALMGLEQHIRRVLHKGNVQFCISDASCITEIPEAYQEAQRIQKICTRCSVDGTFVTYEQLGVLAILSQLPQNAFTQRFTNSLLQPLKKYDAAHNTNLLATLEMYLNCLCNAKLTAERMFVHYNTIIYRLERIREISGFALEDAEQVLSLQIALKIDTIQPGW